jgi:predicted alpha/beta-hydrolase family hydrolase
MALPAAQSLKVSVETTTSVSALFTLPPDARACYVFAPGAGAGIRHSFMEAVAAGLAERRVATLRYQFPYMERGSRRPDPPALCHSTVRAAVEEALRRAPGLPLVAGGKSFGGRMTSQAQAANALPGVSGLAFVGFPLHPAKKPSDERATHLANVKIPMLFLQGTRDDLADLTLLEPLVSRLGAHATLKKIEGADHSFHVLARSGRNDREVLDEVLDAFTDWLQSACRVSARKEGAGAGV